MRLRQRNGGGPEAVPAPAEGDDAPAQRTPLRIKLITALLALVALALAVISFTSVAVLRGYLLGTRPTTGCRAWPGADRRHAIAN